MKRLLIALADEEEEEVLSETSDPAVYQERLKIWPPWPWPPWGPEDPGDGDDDGDNKPINRTKEAGKLAQEIIIFEKKLANVSLDL